MERYPMPEHREDKMFDVFGDDGIAAFDDCSCFSTKNQGLPRTGASSPLHVVFDLRYRRILQASRPNQSGDIAQQSRVKMNFPGELLQLSDFLGRKHRLRLAPIRTGSSLQYLQLLLL